jgi:hypothetical protein
VLLLLFKYYIGVSNNSYNFLLRCLSFNLNFLFGLILMTPGISLSNSASNILANSERR